MMYGCHNKPRPTADSSYVAQRGWGETFRDGFGNPCRVPEYIDIKSAFGTRTCQYDKSATDKSCKGCQWAKTV